MIRIFSTIEKLFFGLLAIVFFGFMGTASIVGRILGFQVHDSNQHI